MSKHTPGQWKAGESDAIAVGSDEGFCIASVLVVEPGIAGRRTAQANARLIAAAPDLLNACANALQFVLAGDYDLEARGRLKEQLKAAIDRTIRD